MQLRKIMNYKKLFDPNHLCSTNSAKGGKNGYSRSEVLTFVADRGMPLEMVNKKTIDEMCQWLRAYERRNSLNAAPTSATSASTSGSGGSRGSAATEYGSAAAPSAVASTAAVRKIPKSAEVLQDSVAGNPTIRANNCPEKLYFGENLDPNNFDIGKQLYVSLPIHKETGTEYRWRACKDKYGNIEPRCVNAKFCGDDNPLLRLKILIDREISNNNPVTKLKFTKFMLDTYKKEPFDYNETLIYLLYVLYTLHPKYVARDLFYIVDLYNNRDMNGINEIFTLYK